MKRLVIDLDDTLTVHKAGTEYIDMEPNLSVLEKLREYKVAGFDIVIHTSRNMRTYENSIGRINAHTLPIILEWLKRHDVPFDEIHVGKPWCGQEGFYVDDRAVRPSEFLSLSLDEITVLTRPRRTT